MNKTYCALCGILLIAVAILLGLSLAGYSPSDSLMGNYYPAHSPESISNPCGYWGAWIS